jgi:hypothetical protein
VDISIFGHADFDANKALEVSVSIERAQSAEAFMRQTITEEAARIGQSAGCRKSADAGGSDRIRGGVRVRGATQAPGAELLPLTEAGRCRINRGTRAWRGAKGKEGEGDHVIAGAPSPGSNWAARDPQFTVAGCRVGSASSVIRQAGIRSAFNLERQVPRWTCRSRRKTPTSAFCTR